MTDDGGLGVHRPTRFAVSATANGCPRLLGPPSFNACNTARLAYPRDPSCYPTVNTTGISTKACLNITGLSDQNGTPDPLIPTIDPHSGNARRGACLPTNIPRWSQCRTAAT